MIYNSLFVKIPPSPTENTKIWALLLLLGSLNIAICQTTPCITYSPSENQLPPPNERSLLESLKEKPDTQKVFLMTEYAWSKKSENPEEAFRYAEQALKLAQSSKYQKGIANSYHILGMLHWYQGTYEQASTLFFKALTIRERINDLVGLARSYNNIGNTYFRQKNFLDAEYYYQKSLNIREQQKDSIGLIYSYDNIADVQMERGKVSEAYENYRKALSIATKCKNKKGEAFASSNLGHYFLREKKFDTAFQYFQVAYAINKTFEDKYGMAKNLSNLANTFIQKGKKVDKAIEYSKQSLKLIKIINAKQLESDAYANLSAAYAIQENFKLAYQFEKQYREIETQLVNENKERAIIDIQTKYELANRESELLKQENLLLQNEKELNNKNIFIIALVLLVCIVIGFFIYNQLTHQQRTNQLLAEKNKQLIASNQALERFAYVSSHDLKEPLRTIGSFSTLLKRRYNHLLDNDGREYIRFIVKAVNQMYLLLDDLLEYSRLIHKEDMPYEDVNLNKVLDSVKIALNQRLAERNVALNIPELPHIKTNQTQMHQLFQNLINNAIKFNDKDQPAINVHCKNMDQGYLFSVKDNGIGISQEYHEKIFGVFQRLSKEKYPGTGVGLAICKKIVEQHDGKMWVESEEGEGSTFFFTIPGQLN